MAHEYVKQLKEQRANAFAEMKALLDLAVEEKRELTAEEDERYDKLNASIDTAAEKIRKIEETEARAAAADALREQYSAVLAPKAGNRDPLDRDIVRLVNGEIRSFDSGPSAPWEERALQSQGGSAFDRTFYDRVTVYERNLIPVLQYATVLETPRGEPIILPRLTTDVATGGTVTAEAAGIAEVDPTISTVTLNAFKYAAVTLWSQELDQDNVIGLEDLLARSVARDLGISYGTHLTTGTGTVQPTGIVAGASNGGTASGTSVGNATDTFFAPYDLVSFMYGLAAPYRSVGTWMVSTTAYAKIRGFRDADKNFLWDPGINGGEPDRFLGRPIVENSAMAAVASATKSILFGDLSRYFVRRTPFRVQVSDEYKFSTDQLAVKTVVRLDANVVDTAGIKYLVSANT